MLWTNSGHILAVTSRSRLFAYALLIHRFYLPKTSKLWDMLICLYNCLLNRYEFVLPVGANCFCLFTVRSLKSGTGCMPEVLSIRVHNCIDSISVKSELISWECVLGTQISSLLLFSSFTALMLYPISLVDLHLPRSASLTNSPTFVLLLDRLAIW